LELQHTCSFFGWALASGASAALAKEATFFRESVGFSFSGDDFLPNVDVEDECPRLALRPASVGLEFAGP
jgi:hypothetical protein